MHMHSCTHTYSHIVTRLEVQQRCHTILDRVEVLFFNLNSNNQVLLYKYYNVGARLRHDYHLGSISIIAGETSYNTCYQLMCKNDQKRRKRYEENQLAANQRSGNHERGRRIRGYLHETHVPPPPPPPPKQQLTHTHTTSTKPWEWTG